MRADLLNLSGGLALRIGLFKLATRGHLDMLRARQALLTLGFAGETYS